MAGDLSPKLKHVALNVALLGLGTNTWYIGDFSKFKNLERISSCMKEKYQDLTDELVIQKLEPKYPVSLKYGSISSIRRFCISHDGAFFVVKHVYYRRAWIGFSEKEFFGRNKLWLQAKSEKEDLPKDEYDFEEYLSRIKFGLHMVKKRSSKNGIKQTADEDSEEQNELDSGDKDEEPGVGGDEDTRDNFLFL
ncbi:hypothetical protein BHYA_0084g00250 [Botrytis hyacinthi]|uniref:Uncharacterized protein n=1 Tax=Botrytis hyacinthi TaxID=278943 RepID=A0A4Z1GM27_9HELO|nr:hypothetical protein BHYA_0084g00250 [Botrytis hyacinthi]